MTGYMPPAKSQDWQTPPALFDALDAEFGPFTCDPAAQIDQYTAMTVLNRGGLICIPPDAPLHDDEWHLQVYRDGLAHDWSGRVYLNPPYGREMPKWIAKAVAEVEAGNCELVCALIPARTDTKAWQTYILNQFVRPFEENWTGGEFHEQLSLVRFLPGRVKFSGHKDPAPFPSAVVVWQKSQWQQDQEDVEAVADMIEGRSALDANL